jgi:hypothetical protein
VTSMWTRGDRLRSRGQPTYLSKLKPRLSSPRAFPVVWYAPLAMDLYRTATGRFAAIVTVGPKTKELFQSVALIESLAFWEPEVGWCIVVEDARQPTGLDRLARLPTTCRTVTLLNPRRGEGHIVFGAIGSGVLLALAWIQEHTDADFVLKIEPDALVIGPFAERVRSFLVERPDAGVIGTLGNSCNPAHRSAQPEGARPWMLTCYHSLDQAGQHDDVDVTPPPLVPGVGRVSLEKRRLFDRVRPYIAKAIQNGYERCPDIFIQEGAEIITRSMIERMASSGYLAEPQIWMDLPFGEGAIFEMFTYAVGLRLYDCSAPGQPFGVQDHGLAYPPAELVAKGYSLIHSIKNDPVRSEGDIRAFFRQMALTSTH